MTLESEFEVFDDVYIISGSNIVKANIRKIIFPDASRHNSHPESSSIQYGCCTEEELNSLGGMQEDDRCYEWRFKNQIGKTKKDLLNKLLKE